MTEKEPTPISRGVELQKSRVEEIRKQALNRYKSLTELSKKIEEKLDVALSQPSTSESLAELATLFEQKHMLEGIGHELEEMILRGFEHQDQLQERWVALEQRIAGLENR